MRVISGIYNVMRICNSFGRRGWLAWRYVRALGYAPMVAWAKARRAS